MRVLLMKTSSMGDVIHALPALTDAKRAIPSIEFDWVVEESFAEIPHWHPAVREVIPISFRKWRKGVTSPETRIAWRALRQRLRAEKYDMVLDAQGLAKSAFLCMFAQGLRVGLDFGSAREWPAAFAYQRRLKVNFEQHAVVRMRQLFSQALGYDLPETLPDFGLDKSRIFQSAEALSNHDYLVFLHATTWESKQWPERYWIELAKIAAANGLHVKTSGGNPAELARSVRISEQVPTVEALSRLTITQMAQLLVNAKAAVAVDTGFAHLAAALDIPTISIYGSTNPEFTGVVGAKAVHLAADFPCSPCYARVCQYRKPSIVKPACYGTLPPEKVWEAVTKR